MVASQLAFVDFHAHLLHTEVIGLLGGTFDPETGHLFISSVFPCNSVSSGTECEMDPFSELEASDYFGKQGLGIVGWYHSHPIFQPCPSLRDIETQHSYQQLVTDQGSIKRPFVGLIVSPYDKSTCAHYPFHSTFRCIWVLDELDESTMLEKKPINCPFKVIDVDTQTIDWEKFQRIYDKCKDNYAFVNLDDQFGNCVINDSGNVMRRKDKLKCSLLSYFASKTIAECLESFLNSIG